MESYDRAKFMSMKREALGYSRRELCERCNGMSEKTLTRLEKGKSVRKESIKELLEFYHQCSHTIYPVMELEMLSMTQVHNEVLALMFQGNYREAKRRQEFLEGYVKEGEGESVRYSEVIGKELQCYMGEKETDREEGIQYFEKQIAAMMPEGADLEKWPLQKKELHIFLAYFNALTLDGRYEEVIPTLRKLLANLERRYHDMMTFSNLYGCFSYKLVRALRKTGQWEDILEIAEKGLKVCEEVGDISNTCGIQSELLCYFEENEFFHDAKIKEQCFETAKEMYYLSEVVGDKSKHDYFRRFLERVYGYTELY
ncbi:MAG: helix-turn-helix domain-containing protein [Lachnospiraceae bacterium]|nr:helix-turn-helix domain-containing protein [Lachnospiraceae bacterium]